MTFRISGEDKLQDYLKRLQELSQPKGKDKIKEKYVEYINVFLEGVGNERIHLVGSTGENTKLKWSKDGGDVDLILVSGELVIPTRNLKYRTGMEDYIWIRSENLDCNFCENTEYLRPNLLKTVSSDLFVFLRGIYLLVTATNEGIPYRSDTAIVSKVGLAIEKFNNLWIGTEDLKRGNDSDKGRNEAVCKKLKKRWQSVSLNQACETLFRRFARLINILTNTFKENNLSFFAKALNAALNRPLIKDVDCYRLKKHVKDQNKSKTIFKNSDNENIIATFEEKSSMDFVPALRVTGDLPFMDEFRVRIKKASWPGKAIADRILKNDIFIVSRLAPVEPNEDRDFRLSFNIQEKTLAQNFPPVARTIYIVLKSYLKGTFEKRMQNIKITNKLRSYHMKTIMFWMCEREAKEFWSKEKTLFALEKVLTFLKTSLQSKNLEHYFIRSNLFSGFEDFEFEFLSACVKDIIKDPVGHISDFFEMDKAVVGEILLNKDQIEYLKRLESRGGMTILIDKLEDAFIDFTKGFNRSPKKNHHNNPIIRAVLRVMDFFFEDKIKDEIYKKQQLKLLVLGNFNQLCKGVSCKNQYIQGLVGWVSFIPSGQLFLNNSEQMSLRYDSLDDGYLYLREAVYQLLTSNDENEETKTCKLLCGLFNFL